MICKKCNIDKPLDIEHWKPNKATKSGWQLTQCRLCFNEYYRIRVKNNPEQRREKERKYAENNPEKYAAKQKRHHERLKERGANLSCNRNPETVKRAEANRKLNPARKLYEKKRWSIRRDSGYNEKERQKYIVDPMPKRIKVAKRRALKMNAAGTHTAQEFRDKLAYHGFKCYYCDCSLTIHTATEDHRIPLSRGGADFISNIVPACGSCNSSKGAKTEQEYMRFLEGVVICAV